MDMLISTAIAGTVVPAAAAEPDPIFAVIEAHKDARSVVAVACDRYAAFERDLKANNRLQEKKRLPDECRRGEEIEAAISAAHDAEDDVACSLVNIFPTTMAGVVALLRYANDADVDGEGWPRELQSDGGSKIRPWHYF